MHFLLVSFGSNRRLVATVLGGGIPIASTERKLHTRLFICILKI